MCCQADERVVAGEGFMLNLLTVMHLLSERIDLRKVDVFYPNHPQSRINIKEATRFKTSAQEVVDWIEKLSSSLFLQNRHKIE